MWGRAPSSFCILCVLCVLCVLCCVVVCCAGRVGCAEKKKRGLEARPPTLRSPSKALFRASSRGTTFLAPVDGTDRRGGSRLTSQRYPNHSPTLRGRSGGPFLRARARVHRAHGDLIQDELLFLFLQGSPGSVNGPPHTSGRKGGLAGLGPQTYKNIAGSRPQFARWFLRLASYDTGGSCLLAERPAGGSPPFFALECEHPTGGVWARHAAHATYGSREHTCMGRIMRMQAPRAVASFPCPGDCPAAIRKTTEKTYAT